MGDGPQNVLMSYSKLFPPIVKVITKHLVIPRYANW